MVIGPKRRRDALVSTMNKAVDKECQETAGMREQLSDVPARLDRHDEWAGRNRRRAVVVAPGLRTELIEPRRTGKRFKSYPSVSAESLNLAAV